MKMSKIMLAYTAVSTVAYAVQFVQVRGLGKEDDMGLLGKAIDRIAGYPIEPDSVVTLDGTELRVSYNPYMHMAANRVGCGAMFVPNTNEVFTDNNYRKMSPATQRAMLAHELGHYKLAHKGGILYPLERLKAVYWDKSVLKMELEADMYAAKLLGVDTYLKAMQEWYKVPGVCKKELILRAKYIKKHASKESKPKKAWDAYE